MREGAARPVAGRRPPWKPSQRHGARPISPTASAQHTPFDHDSAIAAFRVLRAKASAYAFAGTAIAAVAVILGTLLVCQQIYDGITITNVIRAHRENIAIWALDAMPLLFAWWGQYASMRMAHQAGSIVDTHTDDLRRELEDARYTARTKTDFFARMSHELRTPLDAILGMSELLMDTTDAGQRRRHARVIRDSAHGLLTLINDVLDFSRIEAGRMELDEVAFDLHEHLNGAATLMSQQARAKGLRLISLVPRDAPRLVVGDPGRLRQIVINLVGNAIKFTRQGEVVLNLKAWETRDEGGYDVRIEVADTGTGIAPTDQATLFEPYHRVRNTRQGGTGLGLSITRELVHAMNGEIGVDSEPGQGSMFWFTVEFGAAATAKSTAATTDVALRGRRLLLVDADDGARETLAGQLRALGMQISESGDGVDAMQRALRAAADGAAFDIVLADMFAPHLSGEELGRRLKARAQTRDTCLAIMTTAGARGDAKRLNDAGFAGYLTRPIPPEHLQELFKAILATRGLSETERRRQGLITRYYVRDHAREAHSILVVDDSEINRVITMDRAARLGIRSDGVADGESAIHAVRGGRYAAVLLDLNLPDLSGDRVIERIRALDEACATVPILVLTAGATDEQARRCQAAGANDILTKPAEPEKLQVALSRYLALQVPVPPTGCEAAADDRSSATPDPGIQPELARIFLRETDHRIEEMRAALARGPDFEALARHAHAIKSASRHFPAERLSDSARRLEDDANGTRTDDAVARFEDLLAAWRDVRPRLAHATGAAPS